MDTKQESLKQSPIPHNLCPNRAEEVYNLCANYPKKRTVRNLRTVEPVRIIYKLEGNMDNGLLLMAETITDYIRENEWLSEHDKRVLGTLRRDCVCKYSPVGEYKCYVSIKASQQSVYRDICLDTCLQDEVYKLQHKHGIRTIGCCCGHGVTPPYIQVSPEGDNIEQMYLLGYEPLPLDEHGHGHWCFKPKTYFGFCDERLQSEKPQEVQE